MRHTQTEVVVLSTAKNRFRLGPTFLIPNP